MPKPPEHRPSREFPEGITILLERDGIVIRVDDYHARPLKIPWSALDGMRREAGLMRPADDGESISTMGGPTAG